MTIKGSRTVNVTLDEAIRIYARATRAWFGPRAVAKTQERIEILRKAGDLEGALVWERVKRTIAELEQSVSGTVYDLEQRKCA
jgi:hypothetical protein